MYSKFPVELAMRYCAWPLYLLERNPIRSVQDLWWAPASVCTQAENLVPTAGFNPQTVKPVACHYTYVMKVYRVR
jgi:hypothetical protein